METPGDGEGGTPQGWGLLDSERMALTVGYYYPLAPIEENIEMTSLVQQTTH